MIEEHYVCGIEVRVLDYIPETIVVNDDGQFVVYSWEGAELAQVAHCSRPPERSGQSGPYCSFGCR